MPINGLSSAEVSDMYDNLLVPAGFTFSIWGVIYLLLSCYFIYYGTCLLKKESSIVLQFEKYAILFILSSILNGLWMIFFHHLQLGITVLLMIGILICLTRLFLKTQNQIQLSLWPKFAFEAYFAWINVAMVANICAFLTKIEWNGFGIAEINWAYAILGVLITLGIYISFKFKTIIYPLVISWAIYGIHSNLSESANYPIFIKFTLIISIIFALIAATNVARDMLRNSVAD